MGGRTMRYIFVYPASLLLLLTVSPSYGAEWERHLDAEVMTQSASFTTSNDWSGLHESRQRQLERGVYHGSGFDIESLPPPAAGPKVTKSGMSDDWSLIQTNRRRQLERGMH